MKTFLNILSIVAIAMIFLSGIHLVVLAQTNSSETISPTVAVYSGSYEAFISLAIAIVSLVSTFIARSSLKSETKDKAIAITTEMLSIANMLKQDRQTREEAMQTVYEMLPEESQKIVNRPLVRLQKLNADVSVAESKVNRLNNLVEKFGGSPIQ